MDNNEYIIPTNDNPIFKAEDDHSGWIDRNMYKDALIGDICTSVFATSYEDAILSLHNWIRENKEYIMSQPLKAKYSILSTVGKLNKHDEVEYYNVYSITNRRARKYLL